MGTQLGAVESHGGAAPARVRNTGPPPLVLKADGGPASRSEKFNELLDDFQVELLPSPPRCPEYNGSCEAANHSMKKRTANIATDAGHPEKWFPWDLELARLQANHTARPWGLNGPTPAEAWEARSPVPDTERARFRATCAALRADLLAQAELTEEELGAAERRAIQRQAVSRALVAHGYLIVTRRLVHPPISTVRTA